MPSTLRLGLVPLVLAIGCATCLAADMTRTPVDDARPLLIAALSATDGSAHGVLRGEMAEAITRRFGATSPIYIDVTTQRRYRQEGCARLSVLFWQEGVKLPDQAAARRQTIEFTLNYCVDGLPPRTLR